MESSSPSCDIFFVARLGADAVATVGLTESMLTIIYALAMGLGIGATATVARRIGEKDADGAARAAVQAIALGRRRVGGDRRGRRASSRRSCSRLMGATPSSRRDRQRLHARDARRQRHRPAALPHQRHLPRRRRRGDRDARAVARERASTSCSAPCLIFGLGPVPGAGGDRGGRGDHDRPRHRRAATSSACCRGARTAAHRARATCALDPARDARHAGGCRATGRVPDAHRARRAGSAWCASSRPSAARRWPATRSPSGIVIFALLPAWGLANAAATMVGQALGAGKPDRAERAVWLAARYNVVFLGARERGVRGRPPRRSSASSPAIRTWPATPWPACASSASASCSTPSAWCSRSAFNGAGDTWTPTWINIGCFWLLRDPAGLGAGGAAGLGADRRLRCDHHRFQHARGDVRAGVLARAVENAAGLDRRIYFVIGPRRSVSRS